MKGRKSNKAARFFLDFSEAEKRNVTAQWLCRATWLEGSTIKPAVAGTKVSAEAVRPGWLVRGDAATEISFFFFLQQQYIENLRLRLQLYRTPNSSSKNEIGIWPEWVYNAYESKLALCGGLEGFPR